MTDTFYVRIFRFMYVLGYKGAKLFIHIYVWHQQVIKTFKFITFTAKRHRYTNVGPGINSVKFIRGIRVSVSGFCSETLLGGGICLFHDAIQFYLKGR